MVESIFGILNSGLQMLVIQWAPLDVPLHRRLQTLAAAIWISLVLFGELVAIAGWIYLIYSDYYWLGLAYTYFMLKDIDTDTKGGRQGQWVRNWKLWEYFRDYFPIKLVKTVDLDPEKNYLFCSFPHGFLSTGAFGCFNTNALGFSNVFPGLRSQLLTLRGHFMVPLFREFALAFGACSASAESVEYLLDKKNGTGRCPVLIVGGAAEAINTHPGEYKVVLSRRKGFVRIALKKGAPLVPVFSFGEGELYDPPANPENSLMRYFQEKILSITGIAPVFPLGRGMFQYNLGIVPRRHPIVTVVGEPLELPQIHEPTNEQIEEYHAKFTERLRQLFEKEKHNYVKNPKEAKLVIF